MTSFSIASCGTDIGKTFIACALTEALRTKGRTVQALKPVISGMQHVPLEITDSGRLLHALGREVTEETVRDISPWQFQAPLAPSIAARQENKPFATIDVLHWCHTRIAEAPDAITFVEGAGGVMAPLNDTHTMRDLYAALNLPVILVVGCYLGSISHALTALEALRPLRIACVIVSDKGDSSVGLATTYDELARFVPKNTAMYAVPYVRKGKTAHADEIVTYLESLC